MRNLLYIVLLMSFMSCKTSQQQNEDLTEILSESLGSDSINMEFNAKDDYILASSTKSQDNIPGTEVFKYVILKTSDNSIIRKDAISGGSAKWIDDYKVEVVAPPGMAKAGTTLKDYTFIFNIKENTYKVKKEMNQK